MKYTLEEILQIFEGHAKEVETRNKEERINPDFNLPAAFVCMIKEIMELRKKNE